MPGLLLYRYLFLSGWFVNVLVRMIRSRLAGTFSADTWRARFGAGPKVAGPVIWVHASALGEVTSTRALIESLLTALPDVSVVLTTQLANARDAALGWNLPRISVSLAPCDLRWALRRFLTGIDCRLHITVEREFWPNRILLLSGRGVPVVAVSAKMSKKDLRAWRLLGGFGPSLLRRLEPCCTAIARKPRSADRRRSA